MRRLNLFNKTLIAVTVLLVFLFASKIYAYRFWERHYYTSSVSNPKEFPIHLMDISFLLENDEREGDFYKDIDMINSFYSDWGQGEYYEAYQPRFLPRALVVEYMDFRTKKYYADTIALPEERMQTIFSEAKRNDRFSSLSYIGRKMGLEFHVGIADDGHIITWLLGKDYQAELYRKRINPKPFPINATFNTFADSLFNKITDSVKQEIMAIDISEMHYQDSIPIYFERLNSKN